MMIETEPVAWPIGGLWDGTGFEIQFDVEMERIEREGYRGSEIECPHASAASREATKDGPHDAERVSWRVPRVVVAWNEAGHASTGVCADCIVDAVHSLDA